MIDAGFRPPMAGGQCRAAGDEDAAGVPVLEPARLAGDIARDDRSASVTG
jgi:hypothetical protein